MSVSSSELTTLIEAALSFLTSSLILAFCAIIVIEELKKTVSLQKIKRCLKLMLVPLGLMIARPIEKTIYFTMYGEPFSLKSTWPELIIWIVLFATYAVTVFGIVKSWLCLVITCATLMLVEVAKLVFPNFHGSYVAGAYVYLSGFISAVLLYTVFLFLAFSIADYQRKDSSFEQRKQEKKTRPRLLQKKSLRRKL
jgi:hypothetical protein